MSYISKMIRGVVVVALLLGVACGRREITTRPSVATARDAGGETGRDPDDRCLVPVDGDKREPGQACSCATDCTTGNCDQGVCCEGAACGAKRPEGSACSQGDQCESGFCADGVCCNVACTGACLACNLPEMLGECSPVGAGAPDPHGICRTDAPESCGQSGVCNGQGGCAKYPADTVCDLGSCDPAGQFVPPSTCDGDGTCVKGVAISCSPSKCIGSECARVCTSNDQCVAGKECLNGSCGKFGNGQSCSKASDCESNFCVDGVCCAEACDGACLTCASPAARGQCVPVAAGVADSACPVTPASTCGTNGKCDGDGECAVYDNSTVCRPARCDAGANRMTVAARCDDGVCPAPQTRSCAPFQGCSGTACLSSCGSDGQCAGGNVCTGGSCGKRPDGGRCSRDSDCDSGICAQGFCCATQCSGVCKSCGLPGQQGTCANVPVGGADPSGACRDDACNNQCNGQGACRREPVGTRCGGMPTCAGAVLTERRCNASGVCEESTRTCTGATPVCTPAGCARAPGGPGDPCLKDGDCMAPHACVNNVCGCAPRTCPANWQCGSVVPGCGDNTPRSCGTCPMGTMCNAANRCVACPPPACGNRCNTTSPPNACGETRMCGGCPVGMTCNASNTCVVAPTGCMPACGPMQTCTAGTCACPAVGRTKKCGTACCLATQECNGNGCMNPAPVCTPACGPDQTCGAGNVCRCPANGRSKKCGTACCLPTQMCNGNGCMDPPPPPMCMPACGAQQRCENGMCQCPAIGRTKKCGTACCLPTQACDGNGCALLPPPATCSPACTSPQTCVRGMCRCPANLPRECGSNCCPRQTACGPNGQCIARPGPGPSPQPP